MAAPERSAAQVAAIQWQSVQHAPDRPAGRVFTWNNDPDNPLYSFTDEPLTAQTAVQSGREWWLDHTPVHGLNGEVVAYVAIGYAFPQNWSFLNGNTAGMIAGFPDPTKLERYERRLSPSSRQVVGYFSPQGVLLWYRYLGNGVAHGVTIDREGFIVISGEGYNYDPFPETPGLVSLINPAPGYIHPITDAGSPPFGQPQLTITKMDQSGNVVWSHFYNIEDDLSLVLTQRCVGQSIVETNSNGTVGYRVAGWHRTVNDRPCIVDVDANGLLRFKLRYDLITGVNAAADNEFRAMYISRVPFSAGEKFAITGYHTVTANSSRTSAWMAFMDDAVGTQTDIEWTKDVYNQNAYFGADLTLDNNANRVAVTQDGNNTRVVWPVMLNYRRRNVLNGPFSVTGIFVSTANREATARLYKFDGANGNPLWSVPPDLGPVRALDLFYSAKQMPNGNIVVASSKLSPGYSNNNPMDPTDLPGAVQSCLTSVGGLGYDPDGSGTAPPFDWIGTAGNFNNWGHFGTDSWAAIVSHTNGSRIWQYQWDEGTGATADDCFEDNWRQRQCDFQVSADNQNDLVVCGNAGRNFDDHYLAKIQPSCDAKADYSLFEAMYPNLGSDNPEVHITTAVTWSQSMNVRGSIIIEQGGSLVITGSNTVIRFADSRKMGYPCNIVVMPRPGAAPNAGDLKIQDGATVTSLAECPESMWDGVRVLGTGFQIHDVQWRQGELYLESGATISNALVAATNCEVDPLDPAFAPHASPGGIIKISGGRLLNNRYGVVMRPYTSEITNSDPWATSYFYNGSFISTAPLNYPDLHPETFLWFDRNPMMKIGGNTFDNQFGFGQQPTEKWGSGIFARGTSIWVLPMCGNGNTWDNNCTYTNIGSINTFNDLIYGVEYLNTIAGRQVRVRDANMYGCGGGIRADGSPNLCELVRNIITVHPSDFTSSGLVANFGIGVWGQPLNTFTVANNLVESTSPFVEGVPSVGAIFDGTGVNPKQYYNNTFNYLEFGTFIQGTNDGPNPGDGLQIKCNDYGITQAEGQNQYDIVFNDANPTVGDRQGSPGFEVDAPAGNRFNLSGCYSTETNMYVPQLGVNTFTYWHHATNTSWMMKPICRTDPPVADPWFVNSLVQFDKNTACPGYIPLEGNGGPEMLRLAQAEQEHTLLRQVYDSERDGGDTEGLKEYVYNPAHSSSDVRSALMLHAPKVSIETWAEVFKRETPLNPWHLAQALVANSPLQPEVVRMMEESGLTSFYKDLVYGAQNGGISSLTILESEMGYWKLAHSTVLYKLAAAAMDPESEVSLDALLAQEAEHPEFGLPLARIGALIAKGELATARTLVDGLRANAPDAELEVLSLRLEAEINGQTTAGLSEATISRLQELAEGEGPGMFSARTWLNELGLANYPPRILLPTELRAARPIARIADDTRPELLTVYPNPSDGRQPVYVVAHLLDGMGAAEVRVFDPLGRQILAERVNNAVGITEVPTDRLSNGLYSVVLLADGLNVGSTKFQIIR